MRHAIETAPRDGKVVILEDDASGTYDVAHWSPEAGEWVGRDGKPIKITPTHWQPLLREKYLLHEDEGLSTASQAAPSARRNRYGLVGVIAAAAVSLFFYVTRDARQPDIIGTSKQVVAEATQSASQTSTTAPPAPRQTEAPQASVSAEPQQIPQVQQPKVTFVKETPQTLNDERAEALAQELSKARRVIERLDVQLRAEATTSEQSLEQERQKTAALGREATAARQELTASTSQHRQALELARERNATLLSELALARHEIETQAKQLRTASDETQQFKQVAIATSEELLEQERQKTAAPGQEAATAQQELIASTAQLRQALEDERERNATLLSELTLAQREIEAQAQQLRTAATLLSELALAQREIETQARQLRTVTEEKEQLKQTTENTIAELRRALHQERNRTAAMARDLESAQRGVEARVAPEPATSSQISQAAQAVELAAIERPATAEAPNSPEATRLITRASALLRQGDIGAARIVLERAAQTGSAQANFILAETFDPGILSAWKTYGTRGEVTKAREFYAKAHAGGIQEAKDRFDALRQ